MSRIKRYLDRLWYGGFGRIPLIVPFIVKYIVIVFAVVSIKNNGSELAVNMLLCVIALSYFDYRLVQQNQTLKELVEFKI